MECLRPGCSFLRHPNLGNNGGTHCCAACKRTGGHGPMCGQISLEENRRKKKKRKATTTKATTAPATTAMTTAPATTAMTTAPATTAQVLRTSNSGGSKTFTVLAGQTITVALIAQTTLIGAGAGAGAGAFPGSSCKFSYTYPANGTLILTNNDANKSCSAIMGNTSVTVRPNLMSGFISPIIVGTVTSIWNSITRPSDYNNIVDNLIPNQGGYWEVMGNVS